jgi:tyrosine-protein phosphatase SIW14
MNYMEKYFTPSSRTLYLVLFCLLTAMPSFASATEQSATSSSSDHCPPADARIGTSRELSLPAGARFSEHLLGLRGLKNVGRIDSDVYRGAQPAQEGYTTLKEMGIRTVINLRTSESERNKVETAGMRSVEIPLSMLSNGDKDKVDKVVAVMVDPSNRPVFVHCRLGEDRTGIVVAAYRMKIQGWPLSLAEAEMDSFGFNKVWINLRKFLHRYATALVRAKQER